MGAWQGAFQGLEETTRPEIQRINLASVVLQLKALGVEDVVGFDFMDRPPTASLLRALELLFALGAVGPDGRLAVPLGEDMARLPVDPMFAKVCVPMDIVSHRHISAGAAPSLAELR